MSPGLRNGDLCPSGHTVAVTVAVINRVLTAYKQHLIGTSVVAEG